MKTYSEHILAACTGMLLLAACADETTPGIPAGPDGSRPGFATLTLSSGMQADGTRAVPSSAADDPCNEFLIGDVHFFVFDKTGDIADSDKPVYRRKSSRNTTAYAQDTVAFPVNLVSSMANCKVYAVANLPEAASAELENMADPTFADIRNLTVSANFHNSLKPQASFVMDGSCLSFTNGDSKNSYTGTLELERNAAKISLNLNIPESIEVSEGGEKATYFSQTSNLQAYICNSVVTAPVASHSDADGFTVATSQLKSTPDGQSVGFSRGTTENTWQMNLPLYSYPNNWWNTAGNTTRTYILLALGWKRGQNGAVQNYYYQVPVNYEKADGSNRETCDRLVRNTHYTVNLKVGKLGSADKETPGDVEYENLHYTIKDWNHAGIDVSLEGVRFLQMNNADKKYTMNGTDTLSMEFKTSHNVEIVDAKMSFTDFSSNPPQTYTVDSDQKFTNGDKKNMFVLSVDNSEKKVNLKINNNGKLIQANTSNNLITYNRHSSQDNVSPITVTFTLRHTDDRNITDTVSITHYPPIWIEAEYSVHNPQTKSYVYINGKDSVGSKSSEKTHTWDFLNPGLSSAGNKNPYNYIIHIDKMKEDGYIIGDPRQMTSSNPFGGNQNSAKGYLYKQGGSTTTDNNPSTYLNKYYPTQTSSDYDNFVAPALVIASSRAVCYSMSESDAKKRCSAYQENGRPAGRWRLPTYKEIEFIFSLSSKNLIPTLFSTDSKYMASSSSIQITSDGKFEKTTGNSNVRCVYDEWYWGDERLKEGYRDRFTWSNESRTRSN